MFVATVPVTLPREQLTRTGHFIFVQWANVPYKRLGPNTCPKK